MKSREEKIRRQKEKDRGRRKKIKVREISGKSRNLVFFLEWFVGREGRKVASLKRRVRSHLAR